MRLLNTNLVKSCLRTSSYPLLCQSSSQMIPKAWLRPCQVEWRGHWGSGHQHWRRHHQSYPSCKCLWNRKLVEVQLVTFIITCGYSFGVAHSRLKEGSDGTDSAPIEFNGRSNTVSSTAKNHNPPLADSTSYPQFHGRLCRGSLCQRGTQRPRYRFAQCWVQCQNSFSWIWHHLQICQRNQQVVCPRNSSSWLRASSHGRYHLRAS